MPDSLSHRYVELLTGRYDCVDRIVLNAYFRMGHDPGGFRSWWRALNGSDETLNNTRLMRLAGRFSRRIHGHAKAKGIPVLAYGQLLNDLVNFLIVGFAIFLLVKQVNRFKGPPKAAPATKDCPYCASAIPLKASRCPHCTSAL